MLKRGLSYAEIQKYCKDCGEKQGWYFKNLSEVYRRIESFHHTNNGHLPPPVFKRNDLALLMANNSDNQFLFISFRTPNETTYLYSARIFELVNSSVNYVEGISQIPEELLIPFTLAN